MKIKKLLLLVRPSESQKKETITKSGLIIPAGVKEKANLPIEGIVVEIGGGIPEVPMEVSVGDKVWYMKGSVLFDVDGLDLLNQDSLIQIEST